MDNTKLIYNDRLTAVRDQLNQWEVDGLLISNLTNICWLTGFTGSNAQLLITQEQALLATDSRYYQQAVSQAPTFDLFKHERTEKDTIAFIKTAVVAKIGFESTYITVAQLETLQKAENVAWVPLSSIIEPMRQIKNAAELEAVRAAAAITDHTMAQVHQLALPGMSERQLAWELEKVMREAGADGMAFSLIVASGPNGALPHHQPGDRILKAEDAIIIDMGAELNGYKSDLTRSFFLGDEPTEQFWQIYSLVLAAQTAVIDRTKPGQKGKDVDAIAREMIHGAGHEEHFKHGLGHGVGLDIHEAPSLSPRYESVVLEAGMTLTIEPGIYIPNWGGIRIEDLGYIGVDGFQCISQCPKKPVIPLGKGNV